MAIILNMLMSINPKNRINQGRRHTELPEIMKFFCLLRDVVSI